MHSIASVMNNTICRGLTLKLANDTSKVNSFFEPRLPPWNRPDWLAGTCETVDQLLRIGMGKLATTGNEILVTGNMLSLLVGNDAWSASRTTGGSGTRSARGREWLRIADSITSRHDGLGTAL